MKAPRGALWGHLIGLAGGAGYGLCARLVFDGKTPAFLGPAFAAMSLAFLFLVPLCLGAVTIYLAPRDRGRWAWAKWVFLPWGACLLFLAAVAALAFEGAICIVMAAPIFLTFSSVGGVVAGLLLRERQRPAGTIVAGLALLPFLVAPAEHGLEAPTVLRVVETRVTIHAPAGAVWRNVVRVAPISRPELRPSVFDAIGVPLPREATLDRDGVGALRTARFEGGLTFRETVTEWEPERALAFDISVLEDSFPPGLLDRHVRVGGEYFDVIKGRFVLERLGERAVALRLVSVHRVTTRFNAYAGFWTERVMRDLQSRICDVIRARCENASSQETR